MREREYEIMINHLQQQVKEKELANEDLVVKINAKQEEIDQFDYKLMKLKDEQMDFQAKMEKRFDATDSIQQELSLLKEKVVGKDEAISVLTASLMEKAKEHEQMSEKFN